MSRYNGSRPDNWTSPRPYTDASIRQLKYGRIHPMERPGFFEKLVARFRR